jgi:L-asparagine transporter-like permease
MLRVSGTLQKSGEVMKLVNESIKLPEMQRTMFEMSKGAWGGRCAVCSWTYCLLWLVAALAEQHASKQTPAAWFGTCGEMLVTVQQ